MLRRSSGADIGDASATLQTLAGYLVDLGRTLRGLGARRPQQEERLLDDELCLRARDQDGWCDGKVEAPELPDADDIRGRLVACAPGDPFRQRRLEPLRWGVLQVGEQLGPVPAQNRTSVEIDVDGGLRVRKVRGDEPGARPGQCVVKRQLAVVASLSFSAL